MGGLRKLRCLFRALFRRKELDARMDEEIRLHLELQMQENLEAGMSPEEARYAACRQFGGVQSIRDFCRDQRGIGWILDLAQDFNYGARMLRQNPVWTTVAVLTLALGIGANTAIFSVVDAVLLRPLPYPDSEQLVAICERGPDWSGGSVSYPNYVDWKNQQSVFEHFGVYSGSSFTLTDAGEPSRLTGALMSAEVFAALRTEARVGRPLREEDDLPGAPPTVVISHALWLSRFGGEASIVGRPIRLNGRTYSVSGVMPAGFEFPSKVDLWAPVGPLLADAGSQKRDNHAGLFGIARLKPGVTLAQARAELNVIAVRLEQQYPESNLTRRVQIDRLLDQKVGDVRRGLWTLFGAVTFVLVIACANVANLLLARAAAREKEMAVRAALGASQWRILRQLLAESGLLALLGTAVGLIFAKGALLIVAALADERLPRLEEIRLDPRVLLFSALVAAATGLLFGLVPAWHARRPDLQGALKTAGRAATSPRSGLRQGLIVGELALTFVLLAGAGLLLSSFHRLLEVPPGFTADRVLTFRLNPPESRYPTDARQILFYQALLEKLRVLPGVRSASVASQNSIPLHDGGWDMRFLIEGRPEPPAALQPSLQVHLVAPDFFQTMGIPLILGRDFNDQDNRAYSREQSNSDHWGSGLKSIIIDEDFAKRYWPNENPLGQRVRITFGERDEQPVATVIGVVGRVKENRLSDQGGLVQAYFPIYQQPLRNLAVVVKSTRDPAALLPTVRQEIARIDPDLPLFGMNTMKDLVERSVAPHRLNLGLFGTFAVLALALAIIGLYGLLSFMVTQRHREIGVRLALGAQRGEVLHLIVKQGMRLVFTGAFIGLLGAVALTRVLASALFQVEPTDPATFAAVTIVLFGTALLACCIPARRATRIDPMAALRCD